MTARRSLLATTALLMCLSTSARADREEDSRARDRGIFYAALAVTGAGLAGWVFAGTRVGAAEDDLDELGPAVAAEHDFQGEEVADICALADDGGGPASAEAASTCTRGRRWTTIANVSGWVTLGSAAVAGVFAYRAFRAKDGEQKAPPGRAAWRAQPIATPTAVGVGLDVEF